jgi:hypothetical protein
MNRMAVLAPAVVLSGCVAAVALAVMLGSTSVAPLRVALFFDNSESTRGIHSYLRDAASLLYKQLGVEDRVKVFRLGQTLYPLTDELAPQPGAVPRLMAELDRFQKDEYGTSLGAALERSEEFLRAGDQYHSVLVVLTDAADEQGSGTFNAPLPQLAEWGRRVQATGGYVLLVGPTGPQRNRLDLTLSPILGNRLRICGPSDAPACYRDALDSFRV